MLRTEKTAQVLSAVRIAGGLVAAVWVRFPFVSEISVLVTLEPALPG